jgi:hypothetical protein
MLSRFAAGLFQFGLRMVRGNYGILEFGERFSIPPGDSHSSCNCRRSRDEPQAENLGYIPGGMLILTINLIITIVCQYPSPGSFSVRAALSRTIVRGTSTQKLVYF